MSAVPAISIVHEKDAADDSGDDCSETEGKRKNYLDRTEAFLDVVMHGSGVGVFGGRMCFGHAIAPE